jgi:hypothetical protein
MVCPLSLAQYYLHLASFLSNAFQFRYRISKLDISCPAVGAITHVVKGRAERKRRIGLRLCFGPHLSFCLERAFRTTMSG